MKQLKIKKRLAGTFAVIMTTAILLGTMSGCKSYKTDNFTWTNDNAVYASVKPGFENDILNDVEGAFPSMQFQKVYVTEKNANQWVSLNLLFILDEIETVDKQEFCRLLNQDERIYATAWCFDLPFETVDNRYIEKEKDTIAVGETIGLTLKGGSVRRYVKPFDFGSIDVKPTRDKRYTARDFRGLGVKSVEQQENGWLHLELAEENYFNVIKALDRLARSSDIECVEQDKSDLAPPIPPIIWEVSDPTVVSLKENPESVNTVTITGLKPGTVTVRYWEVSCQITVTP